MLTREEWEEYPKIVTNGGMGDGGRMLKWWRHHCVFVKAVLHSCYDIYFMKFNFLSETSPKNITFKKNTGQNQIKIQSYASFCILYVTLSLTNFQNFHKFHV